MSNPERNTPRPLRHPAFRSLLALLASGGLLAAQDSSVEFSDQPAFEQAFTALKPSGEITGGVSPMSTGEIVFDKGGKGSISYILNPAGPHPAAADAAITVTAAFRLVGSWDVGSFGLWAGVDPDKTNGWLALANLLSPNEVRIRIFGRDATTGREKLPPPILDQTVQTRSTLEKSAFYRLRLMIKTEKDRSAIRVSLLSDSSDETLAEVQTAESGSTPAAGGLVGVRLAGERVLWKNLSISRRPE